MDEYYIFGRLHAVTGDWPTNALRLSELNIYEALKIDDPKKLDWKDQTINLKERRLEGAVFDRAKLGKVDARGAHLKEASIWGAHLQDANFNGFKARL